MSESRIAPGPRLVAVWPGMGQVASTAGFYLMSKLQMHETDALSAQNLFDVESIQVKDGRVQPVRVPQNHVFLWNDPSGRNDLVLFIGEAQPPAGRYAFCGRLLDYARKRRIKEVFTFAAMASDMHPHAASRVVGVATDDAGREALARAGVEAMPDGQITGLNGVLLGAAAQRGMSGIGLLGEMPAFAAHVPFPAASQAVLGVFGRMAGIDLDLRELEEYGRSMDHQLTDVLKRIQDAIRRQVQETSEEPAAELEPEPEPGLTEQDRQRIEQLFARASRERSQAFELKRELDRLEAFKAYEDRFLDLFRKKAG